MNKKKINLDDLQIAKPCSTDWESMAGDEKMRFCCECNKDVYNFAAMTRRETELLMQKTGGRICARITRDAQGFLISANAPSDLNLIPKRANKFAGAVVMTVLGLNPMAVAKSKQMNNSRLISLVSQKTTEKEAASENLIQNQLKASAKIEGTISDIQPAVILGATIKLINESTKEALTTVSNDHGSYKFESMSAGIYTIEIDSNGFRRFELTKVEIKQNQQVKLDVTLEVAATMGELILMDSPNIEPSIIPAKLMKLIESIPQTIDMKKKN